MAGATCVAFPSASVCVTHLAHIIVAGTMVAHHSEIRNMTASGQFEPS
jgi:hypothetical protein